jgi:hypothetical protein
MTRELEKSCQREGSLCDPDETKHNSKSQVGDRWGVSQRLPCDEHEYACHEEDGTKAAEEVVDGLSEPSRRRRARLVGSDFFQYL